MVTTGAGRAAAAIMLASGLAGAGEPVAFVPCDEQLAAAPAAYESYLCFFIAGSREGRLDEAFERLLALRGGHPGNGWPTLVAGYAVHGADEDRAVELYTAAAAEFAAAGEARGEVLARVNLRGVYFRRGQRELAAREVELASAVAAASSDPRAIARADALEASHLIDTGGDLARAWRALERARAAARGHASYGLERDILLNAGNLAFNLGRLRAARTTFEELWQLMERHHDPNERATVRFLLANTRLTELERSPAEDGAAELEQLARAALAEAEQQGNELIESRSLALLSHVVASRDPVQAADLGRRCSVLAARLELPQIRVECSWALAEALAELDPEQARQAAADAVHRAIEADDPVFLTWAWCSRMRVAWRTEPADVAAAISLEAIDAIERLRALQPADWGRERQLVNWADQYLWLAGRLLGAGRLADGFGVAEQMRARVLLESLAAAGVSFADETRQPLWPELRQVVERAAALQQTLLDPQLSRAERERRRDALDELRHDEQRLRAELDADLPPGGRRQPSCASLAEVAATLRPDEALLSFQLGLERDLYGDDGGGAWVVVVTSAAAVAHRIPGRVVLEQRIPLFLGLLEREADASDAAAVRLYRDLLAAALGDLPASTDHLIVVADGILHRLPLEALRPDPAAVPVGERYEITWAPSATTWRRWRAAAPVAHTRSALVIADPEVAPQDHTTADLGRLPYARREGRRIVATLGGDSRLVADDAASESWLAAAPLADYQLLHFAAHAVVDGAEPDRSAILLAPAGAADGRLEPDEIAALTVPGGIVVLAACDTAAGEVLAGEGVLSLARPFFIAGAGTVVATRWPLRDDAAERLFGDFYEALAGGATVAGAMRSARRAARAAGAPLAVWAAPVVLGEGGATLERRPADHGASSAWLAALGVLVAGTLVVVRHLIMHPGDSAGSGRRG